MKYVRWLVDYFKNRKQRKISQALKIIKNPKAIKEDRLDTIDFFSQLEDIPLAVASLLQRFEYSLEHSINDTREKEKTLMGIVQKGSEAIPILHNHIIQTNKIAWAIKALDKIGGEKEVLKSLQNSLNFDDISFDQAKVDKNYDVLCYLRDFQLGEDIEKFALFLQADDERVRFACVEVLAEQNRDKGVQNLIEPFLSDTSPENIRIHQVVVDIFLKKNWILQDPEKLTHQTISNKIFINSENKLESRS